MKYIVDLQGFKTADNEFVFKEVAVVALQEDSVPSVFLFKPPHPWEQLPYRNKCENRWLERNYHGLEWDSGRIPYENVAETLRGALKDAGAVFVKGLEKAKWLRKFLPNW